MTDEETRALRHAAETSRSGDDWLRAAWALARARAWDEAGECAARAQAAGADAGEVLDHLTPSLESFVQHPFAGARALERPVFGASGRTFFGVAGDRLVAIDPSGVERAFPLPRRAGAFAVAPDERRVAVAVDEGDAFDGPTDVSLLDTATGALSPPVHRFPKRVASLALTEDVLVAAMPFLLGAVRLDGSSAPWKADTAGPWLDPCGASVYLLAGVLHLARPFHDPVRGPRVAPLYGSHWMAAGLRASVVGPRCFVADARGHVLGGSEGKPGSDDPHSRAVPSPSGWLVALTFHERARVEHNLGRDEYDDVRKLHLVDLRTGARRVLEDTFGEPTEPLALAWSPSGRKLAVTSEGESALVWDADAGSPAVELAPRA